MLEWYEAYADYEDVMRRVEELRRRARRRPSGYDGEHRLHAALAGA